MLVSSYPRPRQLRCGGCTAGGCSVLSAAAGPRTTSPQCLHTGQGPASCPPPDSCPASCPASCLLTPVLMAAPQKTGGCCSASAMRVTSPAAREFLAECGGQHQHSCGVSVVIRLSSSRNLPPGGVRLRVHRPEHALPRRQGRLLLHQLGVGIYIYHCWSCFSGNVVKG